MGGRERGKSQRRMCCQSAGAPCEGWEVVRANDGLAGRGKNEEFYSMCNKKSLNVVK